MSDNEQVEEVAFSAWDLFADVETQNTKTVNFKGHQIEFKYRNLTWGEKSKILDASYIAENGVLRFSAPNYILMCITSMVTDSPIHQDPTMLFNELTISKLDPAVIEQLAEICPATSVAEEMDEVKKD